MVSERRVEGWILAAIGFAALAVAAAMLLAYARDPDPLWRDALHDRNAYLANAMIYAGAWRSLNLPEIIIHAARATIWPPLHGLLLGFVLLPWMDYRLAPVVSLAGWWMTVFISALIARRLLTERLGASAAAALAAILVIASPAFRLLGSDVMLESLGAGFSALALLLYLRAMERPDETGRWRWLAFVLTLLFFEKYNYWAMLVAALAVAFLSERPRPCMALLRATVASIAPRAAVRAMVRDPLMIAALSAAALVVIVYAAKPAPIVIFGKPAGIYPPENLTTIAYALLFARVALLWRRHHLLLTRHVGSQLQTFIRWHLVPVLASFLIPKRISGFVWFLSGANSLPDAHAQPIQAALFQWPGFAEGFHVAQWSAWLVIALAAVGGARIIRMPMGARAVALFPLISAVALLVHPQQQWRFEATWLFGVWICAGVGGATLLTLAVSRLRPPLQRIVGGGVLAVIASVHTFQPVSSMAAAVAIRKSAGPSDLEFARAYLPLIRGRTPVGYLTSFGRSDFFVWSIRSDCGCDRKVEAPFNGATAEEARSAAQAWINDTRSEQIVVVEAPGAHEMPDIGTTSMVRRGALDMMRRQTRFRHIADVPVPAFNAVVSVWRRP